MCKNVPAEYIKKQVLLFIFDFCCTFAEIFKFNWIIEYGKGR